MRMQELMKKYRARLVKEGIIKAALYAAVAAFASLALCTVIFWFTGFDKIWIGAIVFAVVLLAVAPVVFFAFFRPTEKAVAKRIDKDLGLDERMVTMLELRGRNEVIACAQRANAVSVLRAAGNSGVKKIAITVGSVALFVGIGVSVFLGAGMTTVSALSATGVIPSGKDLLSGAGAAKEVYTITYLVEGVGKIGGDVAQITEKDEETGETVVIAYEQTVSEGSDSSAVWAIGGADYYFVGWSDGVTTPYRTVENVKSDMTLTAYFELVDDGVTDPAEDLPLLPGFGGGGGDIPDVDKPSSNDDKENEAGDGDGAGGGSSLPGHQVIDGQTDYGGSTYENAYEQAKEDMAADGSLSDDLIGIIEDYMDIIKR